MKLRITGLPLAAGALCLTGCMMMKHPAKAPAAPISGWTPVLKPFDLAWNIQTGIDANGIPLNPKWAAQFSTPPVRPAFRDTCSDAFAPKGITINQDVLLQKCTSQKPTLDVRPKNIITDWATLFLCPANPIRGHLNWGLATFTGQIQFAGWSSDFWLFDDDANFTLRTPEDAGLTSLGEGLHMEFRAHETLDQFSNTPWWSKLNSEVHSGNPFSQSSLPIAGKSVNGKIAVVTGLIGVDGVHGGYTESHPVYAIAILTAQRQTDTGVEETWDFFLRNQGTQGDCSLLEHHWDDFHGAYYVELPWPEGAADVRTAGEPEVWSYLQDGISGAKIEKASDCTLRQRSQSCTLLRLDVPDSKMAIGAYGELKLAYRLEPSAKAKAMVPPPPLPALATMEFEGGKPAQVRKRLSSLGRSYEEVRANLPSDLAGGEAKKQQLEPPLPPPPPLRRPVSVEAGIATHVWRQIDRVREGSLKPDRATPSPAKEHENSVLNQAHQPASGH